MLNRFFESAMISERERWLWVAADTMGIRKMVTSTEAMKRLAYHEVLSRKTIVKRIFHVLDLVLPRALPTKIQPVACRVGLRA